MCRLHVHLKTALCSGTSRRGYGQKLSSLGIQAPGTQRIEVLQAGEDHELRVLCHNLQDEGHLAEHLLAVSKYVLLDGFCVIEESLDQMLILFFHIQHTVFS